MTVDSDWVSRFFAKVEKQEGACWNWFGAKTPKGYGQIKIPRTRRQVQSHRLSWEIHRGEIPKNLCVLHKCDNPACVNPDHLFLGTKKDNARDMVSKGRHCYGERQGSHKLSEKDVRSILAMVADGKMSQAKIAKAFGIGPMQVSRIKTGKRWAHLQDCRVTGASPAGNDALHESRAG